jgi:hypothetical protein
VHVDGSRGLILAAASGGRDASEDRPVPASVP